MLIARGVFSRRSACRSERRTSSPLEASAAPQRRWPVHNRGAGAGRFTTGGTDGGWFASVDGGGDRCRAGGGDGGGAIVCGGGRFAIRGDGKFFVTGCGRGGRTVGPGGTTPGLAGRAAAGTPGCGCFPCGAVTGATVAGVPLGWGRPAGDAWPGVVTTPGRLACWRCRCRREIGFGQWLAARAGRRSKVVGWKPWLLVA